MRLGGRIEEMNFWQRWKAKKANAAQRVQRSWGVAVGSASSYSPSGAESSVSARACERRIAAGVSAWDYERLEQGAWVPIQSETIDQMLETSFTRLMREAALSYCGFGFAVFANDQDGVFVCDPTETTLFLHDRTGQVMAADFKSAPLQNWSAAYVRDFGDHKIYSARRNLTQHVKAENNMASGAAMLSENAGLRAILVGLPNSTGDAKEAVRDRLVSMLTGASKTAVLVVDDIAANGVSVVGGDVQDVLAGSSVSALQRLVASEYLVPRDLIDSEDSNRTNGEVALSLFGKQTLHPLAWELCEAFNKLQGIPQTIGQIRPKPLPQEEGSLTNADS